MNKKIVHDALILTAFTLALGLILGVVYEITKAPIAAANKAATEAAYKEVFEEATFPYDKIKNVADLDLIVTPKNMDEDVIYLSGILADGINRFLHPDFDQL